MIKITPSVSTMIFDGRCPNMRRSERDDFVQGQIPNLVVAPSNFWKITFQPRLAILLKDEAKLPGDQYTYEEITIEISVEQSR